MENQNKFELIICIVNAGFTDVVMDAAKANGARGGTILHGRGTANKETEDFFGITISPDKEIVLILVQKEIKDAVLHAVYQEGGMVSPSHGIAFSVPVEDVVGLSSLVNIDQE